MTSSCFSSKAVLLLCSFGLGLMVLQPEPYAFGLMTPNPTTARAPASTNDLAFLDRASLLDQEGHRFSSDELAGRLVLVNFIFTQCATSCPIQTEQLVSFLRGLPKEVRNKVAIVSVSVDPANDTPSALRVYAKQQGADMKNWFFLTGQPEEVGRITRGLGVFAVVASAPNAGRHTTDIRLFDCQGRFRQRYSGVPVDKQRLSTDMQSILQAPPLKSY